MATLKDSEELKKTFLELLKTDVDFQTYLKGFFLKSFATREETQQILEEIKNLRLDFNKRMEEHAKQFDKRMEEQAKQFDKRMDLFERHLEQQDKRLEQIDKRLEQKNKYFTERLDLFGLKLSSLGARWGIDSEKAIRKALAGLYGEKFSVNVKQWTHYDKEGNVFGHPSIIELDVVIQNSEHILIEIKSHVRKSDVAELLRAAEVYVKEVKPEKTSLVLISPFVEDNAEEFAKAFNITIYTEKME